MSEERARPRPRREVPALYRTPLGRLSNGFYRIRNKHSGNIIPFWPNAVQRKILKMIFVDGRRRIVVPKARKLGCSTLLCLVFLDMMLSGRGVECGIVDMAQKDASDKLVNLLTFAYERLPEELRTPSVAAVKKAATELAFSNGNRCYAATTPRGRTPRWLLVSELGRIAHVDPKRAVEIQTGAIGAVPMSGVVVVESTAMGKGNYFHALVERAARTPEAMRGPEDWSLCFGAWYEDPLNVLVRPGGYVPKETEEYLDRVSEDNDVVLTPGQRAWYQRFAVEEHGIFRFREHPSTVEECFAAPVEGAIYGDLIARAEVEKRIGTYGHDGNYPCYCAWDIGFGDTTDIWWFQLIGNTVTVLKHVTLAGHTAGMAARVVESAGIAVTTHYLPHDARQHHAANASSNVAESSYEGALRTAGLRSVRVVPRIPDVWLGINAVRALLPRCRFDRVGCAEGLSAMSSYHTGDDGQPVHDWSSHGADAFRTGAEAIAAGLVSGQWDGAGRGVAVPAGRRVDTVAEASGWQGMSQGDRLGRTKGVYSKPFSEPGRAILA